MVGQDLPIGSESGLLVDFLQRLTGLGIGEDAEVADAVKARRQDMGQAASDEFDSRQGHDAIGWFGLSPAGGFSVAQPDRIAIESEDAAVADGDPMGVAGQVSEQLSGTGERWFGIDCVINTYPNA